MMMSKMEHAEVKFVKKCRRLRTRRERVDPTPHKEIQNRSRSSVEKNMDENILRVRNYLQKLQG